MGEHRLGSHISARFVGQIAVFIWLLALFAGAKTSFVGNGTGRLVVKRVGGMVAPSLRAFVRCHRAFTPWKLVCPRRAEKCKRRGNWFAGNTADRGELLL